MADLEALLETYTLQVPLLLLARLQKCKCTLLTYAIAAY